MKRKCIKASAFFKRVWRNQNLVMKYRLPSIQWRLSYSCVTTCTFIFISIQCTVQVLNLYKVFKEQPKKMTVKQDWMKDIHLTSQWNFVIYTVCSPKQTFASSLYLNTLSRKWVPKSCCLVTTGCKASGTLRTKCYLRKGWKVQVGFKITYCH